jgi:hypothetical protein
MEAIDVAQGLDANPQAALKARVFLREWFGGKIRLKPLPGGGLMVHRNQSVGALLKSLGTYGSGGSILSWKSLKASQWGLPQAWLRLYRSEWVGRLAG